MKYRKALYFKLFLIICLLISIHIYKSHASVKTSTEAKLNYSIFDIVENIYDGN